MKETNEIEAPTRKTEWNDTEVPSNDTGVPLSIPLKAEFEELATFRYGLRRFLRFSEEAAQAHGLTPQQHQALLAIQGFPGRDYVTVGELAERLQTRHHSTVGLVNRLAAEGLVARRPAANDRRQVYVRLTPRGMELLVRISAVHREELQNTGPELYRHLQRLLERHGDKRPVRSE